MSLIKPGKLISAIDDMKVLFIPDADRVEPLPNSYGFHLMETDIVLVLDDPRVSRLKTQNGLVNITFRGLCEEQLGTVLLAIWEDEYQSGLDDIITEYFHIHQFGKE